VKKLFPKFLVAFVFSTFIVLQMLVHGQRLNATSGSKELTRNMVFEKEFSLFDAQSTKKNKVVLAKIKEPIVILNFWASWCFPCLQEFKSLNKLKKRYSKNLKVVGINNDTEDSLKEIKKVENKHALLFESIADEEGIFADKFKITRVPASLIFHKGELIYFSNKETDFMSKEVLNIIEKALL